MFIVTVFTITKEWEQPNFLLTNERIENLWHIHTVEHYSAIKMSEIVSLWGVMGRVEWR
jgi:hypothetical protein